MSGVVDWQLTTWPFKIWTLFFWWDWLVTLGGLEVVQPGAAMGVTAEEVQVPPPSVEAVFKASWMAAILSAIPALLSGAADPLSLRTCKVWKILSNSNSMSLSDIKALAESKVLKPAPEPTVALGPGGPPAAAMFEACQEWKVGYIIFFRGPWSNIVENIEIAVWLWLPVKGYCVPLGLWKLQIFQGHFSTSCYCSRLVCHGPSSPGKTEKKKGFNFARFGTTVKLKGCHFIHESMLYFVQSSLLFKFARAAAAANIQEQRLWEIGRTHF